MTHCPRREGVEEGGNELRRSIVEEEEDEEKVKVRSPIILVYDQLLGATITPPYPAPLLTKNKNETIPETHMYVRNYSD